MAYRDNQYLYDLVQFTSTRKKVKDIECLPSFWVVFDKNTNKCVTQYPPPPYNTKVVQALHKMIKNRDAPNDDWPTFNVSVKRQARTYEEGLKKISVLETKSDAFSNLDVPPAEQTAQIEQQKRQKELKKEADSLMAQMQLSMQSSGVVDGDSLSTSEKEHEDSSDDEKCDLANKKRKRPFKSTKPIKKTSKLTDDEHTQVEDNVMYRGNQEILKNKTISKLTSSKPFNNQSESNSNLLIKTECQKTFLNEQNLILNPELSGNISQELDIVNYSNYLVTREEFTLYRDVTNTKLDEIIKNQGHIIALLEGFEKSEGKVTVVTFAEKYNIDFPFKTKADFENFDGHLAEEPAMRTDFIALLNFWYVPTITSVSKQLINLFKNLIVKDVALKYTGSRKSGDKTIIKDYKLIECFNEVFKANNCSNPTEILQAIGVILSNSKDWDGSRKIKE